VMRENFTVGVIGLEGSGAQELAYWVRQKHLPLSPYLTAIENSRPKRSNTEVIDTRVRRPAPVFGGFLNSCQGGPSNEPSGRRVHCYSTKLGSEPDNPVSRQLASRLRCRQALMHRRQNSSGGERPRPVHSKYQVRS
jgi:hypothetical protein